MKKIFLILIGFVIAQANNTNFTRDNATEIVLDRKTHLQWQDNAEAQSTTKVWQDAIGYCEALVLGDKDDWRLPNINELISLVDDGRDSPAIYSSFQNIISMSYLSSTTYVSDGNDVFWFIDFDHGVTDHYKKEYQYHVRCVRGGL